MKILNALTFDIEDWYHILDLKDGVCPSQYSSMESRVEQNTLKILDLLEEHSSRATFFIVGWVARQYPSLVRRISERGHEIASHSYWHTLCYQMTPRAFKADTELSIKTLEDLTGKKIYGYRSPGASIKPSNLWCLDVLIDLNIVYDSSVYPGTRGHGGLPGAPRFPYWQRTPTGRQIFEIPMSCFQILGKNIGFAGGGYLRLWPYRLIRWGVEKYHRYGSPVNVYIHPREFDLKQPRLKMPLWRQFKSYVNLHTTESKLRHLLKDYRFGTMSDTILSWLQRKP